MGLIWSLKSIIGYSEWIICTYKSHACIILHQPSNNNIIRERPLTSVCVYEFGWSNFSIRFLAHFIRTRYYSLMYKSWFDRNVPYCFVTKYQCIILMWLVSLVEFQKLLDELKYNLTHWYVSNRFVGLMYYIGLPVCIGTSKI